MAQALTGIQKAAILMISLGPENSANVIKHLGDGEIEQLTLEMANVGRVSPEDRDNVVEEFHQMCMANDYISRGTGVCSRGIGTGSGGNSSIRYYQSVIDFIEDAAL